MTHEIKVKVETIPKGTAERIMNWVIWGNNKHYYSKEPIKPEYEKPL